MNSTGFRPILAALALGLAACSIPTEAPQWDTHWVLPARSTTVGVEELVPDGVRVLPDGSAFTADLDPVALGESLGNLCPSCGPLDGVLAPKPAFTAVLEETTPLPAGTTAADVVSGTVSILATNGFDFDPLRPAAGAGAATGTLALRLLDDGNGGRVLASRTIDGADQAWAPGETLSETLPLAAGPVAGPIRLEVTIVSPDGDPVVVSLTDALSLDATLTDLRLASVSADLSGKTFAVDPVLLGLEDFGDDVVERITAGVLVARVTNPLSAEADLDLRIRPPDSGDIVKQVTVPGAPESEVRVAFTREELAAMLGRPDVILEGAGSLAGDSGVLVLTPTSGLDLEAEVEVDIRLGDLD